MVLTSYSDVFLRQRGSFTQHLGSALLQPVVLCVCCSQSRYGICCNSHSKQISSLTWLPPARKCAHCMCSYKECAEKQVGLSIIFLTH